MRAVEALQTPRADTERTGRLANFFSPQRDRAFLLKNLGFAAGIAALGFILTPDSLLAANSLDLNGVKNTIINSAESVIQGMNTGAMMGGALGLSTSFLNGRSPREDYVTALMNATVGGVAGVFAGGLIGGTFF